MPRPLATVLGALCATLVLVSCGTERGATDQPATGEGSVSDSASPSTREAVADLARRLDVATAEIAVEGVEDVTWNDGSLGCAEQGTMYTQALVPGSRITLRVGERTYEYHAAGQQAPFLCEDPTQ